MKYYSTNRRTPEVSLREAVVASMAPDNGLYMPERIERLPDAFFDGIARLDLHRIACRVADAFFGEEIEPETLRRIVRDTFCFDIPAVRVDDGIWALELFHGPTMAFKDVGARFMARILSHFIEGRDDEHPVTVLVATSGDTGGAVANGHRRSGTLPQRARKRHSGEAVHDAGTQRHGVGDRRHVRRLPTAGQERLCGYGA